MIYLISLRCREAHAAFRAINQTVEQQVLEVQDWKMAVCRVAEKWYKWGCE